MSSTAFRSPATTSSVASPSCKLQRRKGNLSQEAADEMIDQALRAEEMKRLNIRVTDEQVDAAYERFAKSQQDDDSSSSTAVLGTVRRDQDPLQGIHPLADGLGPGDQRAGAWRGRGRPADRAGSGRSACCRKAAPSRPPPNTCCSRSSSSCPPRSAAPMGKRKREAEAMRARFNGCNTTREFAKGLLDVTVRDLGRMLAPHFRRNGPSRSRTTKVGGATAVRETDRASSSSASARAAKCPTTASRRCCSPRRGRREEPGRRRAAARNTPPSCANKAKIVER